MTKSPKITKMGVIWLSRADKLIHFDVAFRIEYDYIHTVLLGNSMVISGSDTVK